MVRVPTRLERRKVFLDALRPSRSRSASVKAMSGSYWQLHVAQGDRCPDLSRFVRFGIDTLQGSFFRCQN